MPPRDPLPAAALPLRGRPVPRAAGQASGRSATAAARRRTLDQALAWLDGVVTGPGVARPGLAAEPGSLGLFLAPALARGPAAAFLAETEFARLQPLPDGSLVLPLPPAWRCAAIRQRWAVPHPAAGQRGLPPGLVTIAAPRHAAEAMVLARLIAVAWGCACGGAA